MQMEPKELEHFEEPVKIYIADIHRLKRVNLNYYSFCRKEIRKVDIMGVVTEAKRLRDAFMYRVDDCTGEIICRYTHENQSNLQEFQAIEKLQELVATKNFECPTDTGVALEHILEESYKKNKEKRNTFSQGDCVHIQGFIHDFYDKREVNAFSAYKVSSIADEIDRVFELSALYSTIYSKLQDCLRSS